MEARLTSMSSARYDLSAHHALPSASARTVGCASTRTDGLPSKREFRVDISKNQPPAWADSSDEDVPVALMPPRRHRTRAERKAELAQVSEHPPPPFFRMLAKPPLIPCACECHNPLPLPAQLKEQLALRRRELAWDGTIRRHVPANVRGTYRSFPRLARPQACSPYPLLTCTCITMVGWRRTQADHSRTMGERCHQISGSDHRAAWRLHRRG